MSAERRTMYLHIGAPKTGTTYLQSVLWASRRELRQEGVTLPMRRVKDHVAAAHDVRERYDEKDYSPRARGGLDRFEAALGSVRTPRALFSMETIGSGTPEQIERFYGVLEDFELHIVITARDLARQLPSVWQQRLKRRSPETFVDFLDVVLGPEPTETFWRGQDIAAVAQRWAASLPADRVHIVTVPPAGAPKGLLLERFCSVIGVDPQRINTETYKSNPSLSAPQAEVLRRVNIALRDRLLERRGGYNQVVKYYFANQVLGAQAGPPLAVPARYADRVREQSSRIEKDIRSHGYNVVGDLADLEPTAFGGTSGEAERLDVEADDATIIEAGVQAIADMLDQRNRDLRLIDELRTRLDQDE